AAALNLTANDIESSLALAYGSSQVSTIYAPNNAYRVVMELEPQFQQDPNALSLLYVRSSKTGAVVPLSTVAKITPSSGPLTVNHLGQSPSVTLSFNLRPDVSLGTAVDAITRVARQTVPQSVAISFQGTAQAFQSSMQGLGMLLVMSILIIYIVL